MLEAGTCAGPLSGLFECFWIRREKPGVMSLILDSTEKNKCEVLPTGFERVTRCMDVSDSKGTSVWILDIFDFSSVDELEIFL